MRLGSDDRIIIVIDEQRARRAPRWSAPPSKPRSALQRIGHRGLQFLGRRTGLWSHSHSGGAVPDMASWTLAPGA